MSPLVDSNACDLARLEGIMAQLHGNALHFCIFRTHILLGDFDGLALINRFRSMTSLCTRIDTLHRHLSEVEQLKGIDVVMHAGDTMDVAALTEAGVASADCIVALFDSKTASNTGLHVALHV